MFVPIQPVAAVYENIYIIYYFQLLFFWTHYEIQLLKQQLVKSLQS